MFLYTQRIILKFVPTLGATGEQSPSEADQAIDFLAMLDRGRYGEISGRLAYDAARM